MTRVALLPSAYPPALGGVEELTRHLALALADAGDEVEVWTLHGNDAQPETVEVRDDLIVRRFPMPLPATKWSSLHRSATIGPRTLFSLRNAMDAFRPDLLHVVCFGPNGAYATALARLAGLPLIITLQGETVMDDSDIFDTSRRSDPRLRRGFAPRRCHRLFGVHARRRRATLRPGAWPGPGHPQWGRPCRGAHRRPMCFPVIAPTPRVGDPPELPGRPYVLALGRVVEKKGFDLLLSAYAATVRARRTVDLVIGGTGPALDGPADHGRGTRGHRPGPFSRAPRPGLGWPGPWMALSSSSCPAVSNRSASLSSRHGVPGSRWWQPAGAGRPNSCEMARTAYWSIPSIPPTFAAALEQSARDDERRRSVAAAGRARVEEFAWPASPSDTARCTRRWSQPVRRATWSTTDFSRPRGESVS